MLRNLLFVASLMLAVACFGCNKTTSPPSADDGHSEAGHDEHGHDEHGHHHHASKGPHEGELVVLGDNHAYHAEWVSDASGKTTIHLLGGDAQTEVRTAAEKLTVKVEGLKEPLTYELTAVNPDEQKKASQFEITDPQLPVHLQASGEEGVTATISVEIEGNMITGKVEEHEHHHAH